MMARDGINYKEYLRDCSVYDPEDLSHLKTKEVQLPDYTNEELCCMNFKKDHKCIFGSK